MEDGLKMSNKFPREISSKSNDKLLTVYNA